MQRIKNSLHFISIVVSIMSLSACNDSSAVMVKPEIKLLAATVADNILTLEFQIQGLQVSSMREIDDIVCKPYIDTQENVPLAFFYSEANVLNATSQNIMLTYKYRMSPPLPKRMHLNIFLTIGPCGPDFQESNVPPSSTDLIASYKIQTVVDVP